jgi:hypothetical protein
MDNYKTIETALQNRQNFKGNSLRAFWDGDTYKVISYSTVIATLEFGGGPRWVSPVKYSQTTTRQQNLIKRAWGLV